MENKRLFMRYYYRLAKEGILHALIWGMIVGFAASVIPAFVTLIMRYNGLWISIAVGLGAAFISTCIIYYLRFKPTTKKIAERVDRLGLDERLITMIELEKDESYIALLQREDAKAKLSNIHSTQLKFSFVKLTIILFIAFAVLSVGTITLSNVLAETEPPSGEEETNILQPFEETDYIRVTYIADTGGYIEGGAIQFVIRGKDSVEVVAVADEGFLFVEWDDGTDTPERFDKKIEKEVTFIATFARVQEMPGEGQNQGEGDKDSDGEKGEEGGGAGGKYAPNNQVIDGETYYREVYQQYYDQAMEMISSGEEVPSWLQKIVGLYFKIII